MGVGALLLALIAAIAIAHGVQAIECRSSRECNGGCCRLPDGTLIDRDSPFRPWVEIGDADAGPVGVCTDVKGKSGEVCGGGCACGQGLQCYRPVTGMCCPPMRCYDAVYVKQQQDYWSKCFSDPKCPKPP